MADRYDLIDQLIDQLNDNVEGIDFDLDVIDTNQPEDWGALELGGEEEAEWADGHLIDQPMNADLYVCVSDHSSVLKGQVQAVLKPFCEENGLGWKLITRSYLADLNKVLWHWRVTIDGPLTEETEPEEDEAENPAAPAAEPEGTDPEQDDLPFTDPEEDPEAYTDEDDPEWPEMDPEDGDD